jgi:hypothetical protein
VDTQFHLPVSPSGLVDHCHIVCGCLVVLHPAPIDKVQAPLCHQLPHFILHLWRLPAPPGGKEGLAGGRE